VEDEGSRFFLNVIKMYWATWHMQYFVVVLLHPGLCSVMRTECKYIFSGFVFSLKGFDTM
jgi:hypothetical protein